MARANRARVRAPRWTHGEARSVLDAQESSGLSMAAFAAREGLSAKRLYEWRRRLGSMARSGPAQPAFIEIERHVAGLVEVVLRSRRVLRVSESIDATILQRLVAAVEQVDEC